MRGVFWCVRVSRFAAKSEIKIDETLAATRPPPHPACHGVADKAVRL